MYGGATVVVVPNDGETEQMEHARRLAALADVRLTTAETLEGMVAEVLLGRTKKSMTPLVQIDLDGARRISDQVSRDLATGLPEEELRAGRGQPKDPSKRKEVRSRAGAQSNNGFSYTWQGG
jgi:hypothetical protein